MRRTLFTASLAAASLSLAGLSVSASTAATASPQGGPHIIKTQRVSKTQRILTLSNGEREAETVKHIAPGTIQVRVSTLPLTGTDYFECTVYAGGSVGTGSNKWVHGSGNTSTCSGYPTLPTLCVNEAQIQDKIPHISDVWHPVKTGNRVDSCYGTNSTVYTTGCSSYPDPVYYRTENIATIEWEGTVYPEPVWTNGISYYQLCT